MNGEEKQPGGTSGGQHHWRWLLLVPFIGLIWVPFFNVVEPTLLGLPFFYWYQFLWVFLTPAITYWVYLKTD